MDAVTFTTLALACAPLVHVQTAHALVSVESGFNSYAIGVVGGVLQRQPRNRAEAQATVASLQAAGWNFSVGLGQINVHNFGRLGMTPATAFDPCTNLQAMQTVLSECFVRMTAGDPQGAVRKALSCYYSGNAVTGFRHGYVQRVVRSVVPWPGVPP